MYEEFYGLAERPFAANPDPRFLLLTGAYREALTHLAYGILERHPVTLLLGRPGTGKTTLLRAAVDHCREMGRRIVWIDNPALSRGELYEWLAMEFSLGAAARRSKTRCLMELQELLVALLARGSGGALVIDEAHSLSAQLLKEIRLLANLETATTKLLPIVLAGTPEFANRLNLGHHEALKQRVTLRCSLQALTLMETGAYIEGRLRVAGGSGLQVFTADAVRTIHAHAGGVPRLISLLCENALISGFALQERPIEAALIREVCSNFDLPQERPEPTPEESSAFPFTPEATGSRAPHAASRRTSEPVADVPSPTARRIRANEAPA